MGIDDTELAGVELVVNLENTENVEIGYHDFTRVMELDQFGGLPLKDFGSGFKVKKKGIYLKLPPARIWASMTEAERDALAEHPAGRPDKPILTFPFTLRELKVFLGWAASVGHDVPINEDALVEVIEAQNTQPTLDASSPATVSNQSDASLGAYTRQRNRDFSEKNQERHEDRAVEHQRWRDAASEIQRARQRPASLRQLATLVKKHLNLPDAEDTIRKRLADQNLVRNCTDLTAHLHST